MAWRTCFVNVFQKKRTKVAYQTSIITFCLLFGNFTAHRAMEDVRAMKKVFTSVTFTPILANLTLQTKESIEEAWSEKRKDRSISQQYIAKMGKRCSEKLAICLHEKGVSYDRLHEAFQSCNSTEFDE